MHGVTDGVVRWFSIQNALVVGVFSVAHIVCMELTSVANIRNRLILTVMFGL